METPVGSGLKYVPCILKYVRHILNYVGHIMSPKGKNPPVAGEGKGCIFNILGASDTDTRAAVCIME